MGYVERSFDLQNADRAVMSAFEVARDFATSDIGKKLTPKQLLAALAIAAVEQSRLMGLSGQSTAATLRDLANAMETDTQRV